MSRMSDLAGLARGLEKVGRNCTRLSGKEMNLLVDNCYLKPVLQHAVNTIIDSATNLTKQDQKPDPKAVPPDQVLKNVPLVLEGIRLYSRILMGVSGEDWRERRPRRSTNTNIQHHEDMPYKLELNTQLTSMELLDLDLTNEAALRDKLFIKIYLEEEDVEPNEIREEKAKLERFIMDDVKLTARAQERTVPATRLSRVMSFGSLGVGLGLGIVAEASRRAVGIRREPTSDAKLDGSLVLNEANAERIVATLCRVRGAALKLGQILSVQDNTILSPALAAIFDRVRESADFMPRWQLEKVMSGELGSDWMSKYGDFDTKPFAAASIGQVHRATLLDGTQVAVKVQYPGVAKSIDSDIRNLMALLSVLAFLPQGLFIDNIAKHMKLELAQECDYVREAQCGVNMKQVLSQYPEYYVPKVYKDLCSDQVLTTQYITGLTIDQCVDLAQETKNYIAESILKLVFRELFLHRYMQTDPNWANFLYNPENNTIGLLDFGATREFRPKFVNTYFKIIDAAAHKNRDDVLKFSREIGFLTGYETKIMNDAHVDSVMLLAVPFHNDADFDFGKQTITHDIQELSGVMLKHRLCPPPPEVYSLHRKLSGLFLLAGKLNSKFNCYRIWQNIRTSYRYFPEQDQASPTAKLESS